MAAASVQAPGQLHTETWEALGTTVVLSYQGCEDPAIRTAVELELNAIDLAASRFRADSELRRLNAAGGARVEVSPLLLEAVAVAVNAARITDGAVDPTLGELLISAGYDRDWRELTPAPAGPPVAACDPLLVLGRRDADWAEIELWSDPPTVRLPPRVTLDLGATAKALAADRAALAAHRAGAAAVLVALGGDIATAGSAPGVWPVHVTDDHRGGPDAPGQTVSIQSGGLATSSILTRRWSHRGRVRHHILNPGDGQPARTPWRTVSVAAASCVDANIGSTAAVVIGERAPAWLAEQHLPARLVALDGTVHVQGGWPA